MPVWELEEGAVIPSKWVLDAVNILPPDSSGHKKEKERIVKQRSYRQLLADIYRARENRKIEDILKKEFFMLP